MNTREIVVDILLELEKNGGYVNVLLAHVLDKYDYLIPQDKAFIKRCAQGVVEQRFKLDYVLDEISNTPVSKMKPFIRQLLRMSAYQLMFMDKIPAAAVCDEAVKLTKKRRFTQLQGFVNAVLRKLAAAVKEESFVYPDAEKEPVLYMSVMYSMPEWLVEHFINTYGKERAEAILEAYLKPRPVTLRLTERLNKTQRSDLIRAWQKKVAKVKKHTYLPYAVQLEGVDGIRQLEGYEEGLFMAQDISSMLAVEAAGIEKGQTIIDVCASPGGKSLHAADKLAGTGKVLSFDISVPKVERLEENRRRMKAENMVCAVKDAREYDKSLARLADVVLADVPCSGLGVIGRKQDIKYNVTPESVVEIVRLQKEILENVAKYVKPNGILMYSTCTMNPAENERIVEWLCDLFPFKPESMERYLPERFKAEGSKGMLQLAPDVNESDGFFFARLRRE